jgi:hypothetical protein
MSRLPLKHHYLTNLLLKHQQVVLLKLHGFTNHPHPGQPRFVTVIVIMIACILEPKETPKCVLSIAEDQEQTIGQTWIQIMMV